MTDKILVVEDDKKTASLIKLYLEREGFQTVIAYDGRQALELAEQYRPVFVILDLMLPVLDGWEVCRRLDNPLTFHSDAYRPRRGSRPPLD
jgi:DNA-binding response OmpR family regulator